jgi:hypothetical protein
MQDNPEQLTEILQKDTEILQELICALRLYDAIVAKLSEKTVMTINELLQDISLHTPRYLRMKLEELLKGGAP